MKSKPTVVTPVAFCILLILAIACYPLVAPTNQSDTPIAPLQTEIPAETSLPTAINTRSPTPTLQPTIRPLRTPLLSPTASILPANTFAFGPTPHGGQIGGISGVFVPEDSSPPDTCGRTFNLLRFYNDGLVLNVSSCLPGSVLESWPNIKKWFHRDSETEILRGKYYSLGDRIWFSVTVTYESDMGTATVDYSGTYSENMLILDSYSHFNGYQGVGVEFVQVNVDQ